jgi:3-oxoacyl-[acyl-carrier-protein] synthase-3
MKIVSVASAIPENAVLNEAVESQLGLESGWIQRRTGILQRPTAGSDEATSDLAIRAAQRALDTSGVNPNDVALLLLATSTPDHLLPPTAPLVAHRLGLRNAGAIDLAGACSGFLYGVILGNSHGLTIKKPILVIGANILTRRVNPNDAATVALFSDGAGAVVLVPSNAPHFLGSYLGADGSSYNSIGIPAGGTRESLTASGLKEGRHLMTMRRGPALFKKAITAMAQAGKEAMSAACVTADAIDWWVPHQANVRLIEDTGAMLGIPSERTIRVVEHYGNSSAATIPIALAKGVASGFIREGNTVLMTAVGAGVVTAGLVLRW